MLTRVSPPRTRHLRAACLAFLAADIAAGAIALAVHHHHSGAALGVPTHPASASSPGSASDATDARSPAVTWMAGELPAGSTVLADAGLSGELATHGFTVVPASGAPRFTVSTPALRASATKDSSLARAVAAAVPIAEFPTAAGDVVVGESVPTSGATVAAHRATDAQLRRDAGTSLLHNTHLRATTAPAAMALASGAVDLRCATVLALMASNGTVDLQGVSADAAESRAGLPVRTVTFSAAPAAGQRALLLGLAETYRPSTWTQLPDGSYRVTWPIRPDPDDSQR